jgi:hypothetical protein
MDFDLTDDRRRSATSPPHPREHGDAGAARRARARRLVRPRRLAGARPGRAARGRAARGARRRWDGDARRAPAARGGRPDRRARPLWETLVARRWLAPTATTGAAGRRAGGETLLTWRCRTWAPRPGRRRPWRTRRTTRAADRHEDPRPLCAGLADHLVVSATTATGQPGLHLVAAADVDRHSAPPVQRRAARPGRARRRGGGPPGRRSRARHPAGRGHGRLASLQAGVCDAAVRLAAEYTSSREQFDRPIATFQAVSQRVASAFIDAECAQLTALQAAWRLDEGCRQRTRSRSPKFWAADAGHRVLHACQHVHGGIGVDRDYPLHRYLLRTKQYEFALGSLPTTSPALGARSPPTQPDRPHSTKEGNHDHRPRRQGRDRHRRRPRPRPRRGARARPPRGPRRRQRLRGIPRRPHRARQRRRRGRGRDPRHRR